MTTQEVKLPTEGTPDPSVLDYRQLVEDWQPSKEDLRVALAMVHQSRIELVFSLVDSLASQGQLMPHEISALGILVCERSAAHMKHGGNYLSQFGRRVDFAKADGLASLAQMTGYVVKTGEAPAGPDAEKIVDLAAHRAEQARVRREHFEEMARTAAGESRPTAEETTDTNPIPPTEQAQQPAPAAHPADNPEAVNEARAAAEQDEQPAPAAQLDQAEQPAEATEQRQVVTC